MRLPSLTERPVAGRLGGGPSRWRQPVAGCRRRPPRCTGTRRPDYRRSRSTRPARCIQTTATATSTMSTSSRVTTRRRTALVMTTNPAINLFGGHFGTNVRYILNVDKNGNAVQDLAYVFRFGDVQATRRTTRSRATRAPTRARCARACRSRGAQPPATASPARPRTARRLLPACAVTHSSST